MEEPAKAILGWSIAALIVLAICLGIWGLSLILPTWGSVVFVVVLLITVILLLRHDVGRMLVGGIALLYCLLGAFFAFLLGAFPGGALGVVCLIVALIGLAVLMLVIAAARGLLTRPDFPMKVALHYDNPVRYARNMEVTVTYICKDEKTLKRVAAPTLQFRHEDGPWHEAKMKEEQTEEANSRVFGHVVEGIIRPLSFRLKGQGLSRGVMIADIE